MILKGAPEMTEGEGGEKLRTGSVKLAGISLFFVAGKIKFRCLPFLRVLGREFHHSGAGTEARGPDRSPQHSKLRLLVVAPRSTMQD